LKQLFIKGGGVVVDEVPCPSCPARGVLVKNHYSLISVGTESMLLRGEQGGIIEKVKKQPQLIQKAFESVKNAGIMHTIELVKDEQGKIIPLGYSTAGVVIQVGHECSKFTVGQNVACAGAGIANHSEYVAVPENLCTVIPVELSLKEGAFTTVGSIAMQGVRQGRISLGENVAVIGLGLLGLLTVQILKASGANVIGVDLDPGRMEFARREYGIEVISADDEKLPDFVMAWSGGIGVDCALITAATSANQPVEQAVNIARRKGRIVVVGAVGMNIPRSPFYEKELEFTISCSYGPGRYDPVYEERGVDYPIDYIRWTENRNMGEFLRLIKTKKINVLQLVTYEHKLEDATAAFEDVVSIEKKPIGVLLEYKAEDVRFINKLVIDSVPRIKKVVNFAMVGCGNHAASALLPAISQIDEMDLIAVVGKTGKSSQNLGKKYGAQYCTTNYDEVIQDPNVDMVIIATRHDLHYDMIMSAISAGKDIFVEKPVALSMQELVDIYEALEKNPVNFTVGHNRRFSTFSQKAKTALSRLARPFFIDYQINAGFFSRSHWIHDPEEGGGRIVGEMCHFIDLANFFVGTDMVKMNIQAMPVNQGTVIAEDNVALELQYSDGSMAIITYISLGNMKYPKEKIQIHANRSTISIDNFESIEFFGVDERNKSISKPDKGFKEQFVEFTRKIKGEVSKSISPEDSIKSTYYALKAVDFLHGSSSSLSHPFLPEVSPGILQE